MLATIFSAALLGVEAELVSVEVNTGETGDPKLILVGLPDTAVRESNDRVVSALSNSGLRRPWTRTTINLAPGSLRKEGPMYDLPIALAILVSMGQLRTEVLGDFLIAGELSLSGATRPIRGALAIARLAKRLGKRGVLVPTGSAAESALVDGVQTYAVRSLEQAYRFLAGEIQLEAEAARVGSTRVSLDALGDFSEIKGQHAVRRAVEIAAAGAHNLLMIGPPGSGKSMIAKRIPTILPPPTSDEALEILSIQSVAGHTLNGQVAIGERPVRSPHHTISDVGLLGGGSIPAPGEISLAHHGVLFLDELPEFRRSALEVLRQPLEDGQVTISRSAGKITLPCSFMLVAAMNPCPCGYLGDKSHECRCGTTRIERYRSRISGPLLDRIDLHVEAPALSISELRSEKSGETSAQIRARVQQALTRQLARFAGTRTSCNARMTHGQVRKFCPVDAGLADLLQHAMEQLALSARAYDRILKVARTIADLCDTDRIAAPHLLEALQYRTLDRNLFN